MAESLFSAYLTGNVKAIADGLQKIPSDVNFLPFDVTICIFVDAVYFADQWHLAEFSHGCSEKPCPPFFCCSDYPP